MKAIVWFCVCLALVLTALPFIMLCKEDDIA